MQAVSSSRVLVSDGRIVPATVAWDGASIVHVEEGAHAALDAGDMLVLPGMVDLHGDAFERQVMPRPGVAFDMDVALAETDRQLVANGITTAFHAVTFSFEPGLRGGDAVRDFMAAMSRLRGRLACDTRVHLRHEAYNIDAVDEILGWIADGAVDLLAFNDHTPPLVEKARTGKSLLRFVERTGLDPAAFAVLLLSVGERAGEVEGANARLAEAARRAGLPMASRDDETPEMRAAFRELGSSICEFPKTTATAAAARACSEASVLGAPNVVRGGSQSGAIDALRAIRAGLCDVLASDYYYPALLLAPFRVAAEAGLDFARCWDLVSANPASAVGLRDRGSLATGKRADILVVDDRDARMPRVAAVVAAGRPAMVDLSVMRSRR